MLELVNIRKVYKTESFEQVSLEEVNIAFRKSEFVSILGPSGSGKTTCLNIIGGLDRYTSGDLKINGRSSTSFKAEDWDAYRNNTVGFIFQNYNLISHLSVMDNVEMGMTLSGVNSAERRNRAKEVLIKVGLENHLYKKPNQLSGGQMQRVAIARALVNNPEIILADEPTGALDTETSVQIMELIKEIAKEKLVIMVTHNPELAEEYSNRIIQFSDGQIKNDSHPYREVEGSSDYQLKKTSMSFLTALKSSGRNVITKKWRTGLTAFASSVGIIGVALVLALSNGFSEKISEYESEMLSGFPITVSNGVVNTIPTQPVVVDSEEIKAYSNNESIMAYNSKEVTVEQKRHENILSSEYINYVNKIDEKYINGISTTRSVSLPILKKQDNVATKLNMNNLMFTTYPVSDHNSDSTAYLEKNFDLLEGSFPSKETDLLLVVDEYNRIEETALKELGFNRKEIALKDVIGTEYKLLPNDLYYIKSGDTFVVNGNPSDLSNIYNNEKGKTLKISGVIRLKEDATVSKLPSGIAYSDQLAQDFIANAQASEIVKVQESVDYNVLTGELLSEETGPNQITKDNMLSMLGASSIPTSISIYPMNLDAKDSIKSYLDKWNDKVNEDKKIEYTDMASMMTSMLGSIVNMISYVLIAFASISLVVSMIMIGIIVYVSVLERTKEIGILRALGARTKDITRLFNAETFIIGAASGIIGVGITYLLTIPINKIIYHLTDFDKVAHLNPLHAVTLIALSIVLTLVGGLLPSKMAAKKDPVTALRSE
ncbi:ATP-binding cassette domain-containing protein [Lysinibacillus sp. NPDC093197]|uniref:ABC transporter ATP-binding protein/permease n=1 Tax=Lysinibacillus sp. NPDC093197 TaxID=3364132 RepID=UPI00381A7DB3